MGFFKVLGGVAMGIGAVACLPVAGAVGAITITGALVGGAVGGIAGASSSANEEEKRDRAYRQGARKEKVKNKIHIEKLINHIEILEEKLNDDKDYFQLLIAMFAVGMAVANADGEVCQEELDDLNEFVSGISHSKLPPHVKAMITRLKNNPPTLNTVFRHIKKLPVIEWDMFETIIKIISESDGIVMDEEAAFLAAFQKQRAIEEKV